MQGRRRFSGTLSVGRSVHKNVWSISVGVSGVESSEARRSGGSRPLVDQISRNGKDLRLDAAASESVFHIGARLSQFER